MSVCQFFSIVETMKQIFEFSLAICIFGNAFAHTNYLSDLKNSLLYNYDRTTKPFEHVTVDISVRPMNLKLCPHSQVNTEKFNIQYHLK